MPATNHAKKRVKERCGVKKQAADRLADIVFRNGLTREELCGSLRKYVDSVISQVHLKMISMIISSVSMGKSSMFFQMQDF